MRDVLQAIQLLGWDDLSMFTWTATFHVCIMNVGREHMLCLRRPKLVRSCVDFGTPSESAFPCMKGSFGFRRHLVFVMDFAAMFARTGATSDAADGSG